MSTHKVTVLYTRIDDRSGFDEHFFGSHLPAAQATPGLLDIRVSTFEGDETPAVPVMVELLFASAEDLQAGLASEVQAAAKADFEKMIELYGLEVTFLIGTEEVHGS